MDPEKKSLNFIFPAKYVIPKSLKFSHWPSKDCGKNAITPWYSERCLSCIFERLDIHDITDPAAHTPSAKNTPKLTFAVTIPHPKKI